MSENCIFCKLARHEIPAKPVIEDDDVFVFHDLNPQAPVHLLVVPKTHIINLAATSESDSALLGKLLRAAAQSAEKLGIAESGYRIVANVGEHGGQSVDHLHIHVLGGREMKWPPG